MNEPGFSVLRPRLHQSVKAFMEAAVLPASTTLMEGPAGAPPTTDWAAGETAGSNGSWYFGESARLARDRPMTAMATRSQMPYTDPRILVLLGECLVTVLLGCVLTQAETVSQNEYKIRMADVGVSGPGEQEGRPESRAFFCALITTICAIPVNGPPPWLCL